MVPETQPHAIDQVCRSPGEMTTRIEGFPRDKDLYNTEWIEDFAVATELPKRIPPERLPCRAPATRQSSRHFDFLPSEFLWKGHGRPFSLPR